MGDRKSISISYLILCNLKILHLNAWPFTDSHPAISSLKLRSSIFCNPFFRSLVAESFETENSSPFFAGTPVKRGAVYSVHFPLTLVGIAEFEEGLPDCRYFTRLRFPKLRWTVRVKKMHAQPRSLIDKYIFTKVTLQRILFCGWFDKLSDCFLCPQ